MEAGRFFGSLHPSLIHFPIVLLFAAVAFDGLGFFTRDSRYDFAARALLIVGIVFTLVAFICGNFAQVWAARAGVSQDALEYHEFLATVSSWLFVGLTGWKMLMPIEPKKRVRAAWLVAALSACIVMGYTGHQGGVLVFEHGAAVQGREPTFYPSHEDLAALNQRQDQESIFYSEMMHHIFGWLVVGLSLLLLADTVAPSVGRRMRQLGPALLFAGGVFLLIFSDQDAWPLYNVKPYLPITNKEVFLHKLYAVLLMSVGLRGLWVSFRSRRAPDAQKTAGWTVQNRLMAVFSLVGGALLFTHVHSVAPFANAAVGVYLHHAVLGLGALAIGAVKLLDDAAKRPSRWRRLAFPALMCMEGLLLLGYNEGLPWFLGYPRHRVAAPHGGIVATMGDRKAEVTYSPENRELRLFLTKLTSDVPAPVVTDGVDAVVRVGEKSTLVRLLPVSSSRSGSSEFAAGASFLQLVPLFTISATIRDNDKTYSAVFEPWIDKLQTVSTSKLPFACPMHPQVGGAAPGTCNICSMPFTPTKQTRKLGALHDPEWDCRLDTLPNAPAVGVDTRLVFRPTLKSSGKPADLEWVHAKKLHVIVVNDDLSFFDHVHPVPQPDGSLAMNYRFQNGGQFYAFADFTPAGAANQVFRLPVKVDGPAVPKAALTVSPTEGRLFDGYRVGLTVSPPEVSAPDEATLTFNVSKAGSPLTDLQPWLHASGHCVVIRQGAEDYRHSHPIEPRGMPPQIGPDVRFHTRFDKPGLYKVWGQFSHQGKVITADFVVRVR